MERKVHTMKAQRIMRNVVGVLVLLLFGLAQSAWAGLAAVGPVDPANGFPMWYQDTPGTKLELCLDGDGLNGPCFFDPVDPANPWSVQTGFGGEAFYWYGEAAILGAGAVDALLVLGLEAAYSAGDPVNGDQITFGRVRVRVTGLPVDGIYTIYHPYGRLDFNVVRDPLGKRDINYVADIGIGPFSGALKSSIGPYLRWVGPDVVDPARPYVDPLSGIAYLGNPQVPHQVTGSPLGTNFFMIVGPRGAVLNTINGTSVISTVNFVLFGKIATRAGVKVDRAAYQRDALGAGFVDVFASSLPAQNLQVTGVGALGVAMREEPGAGRYYARIPFDGATTPLPATIGVTNISDVPPGIVTVPVTDTVWALNFFDPSSQTLLFAALSSDQSALPPIITPIDAPVFLGPGLIAPPAFITQTAVPGGGSDTEPVIVAVINRPPAITSTAVTTAIALEAYSYQVLATDDPGSTLNYALFTAPAGMTINPTTGLVSWLPPTAALFPYTADVTITVTDQGLLSVSQSFTITVADNLAPLISSLPVLTGIGNQPYTYQVLASDPNGGPVTYSLDVAPLGMTISASGLVAWTPAAIGDFPVTVRVTDLGGFFATQIYSINVPVLNLPPAITSTPVTTSLLAGQPFVYTLVATDTPGDVLSYSLDVAPIGMTIGPTGVFSFTPATAGLFSVTARVTDQGGLFATQSFVLAVGSPPVITSTPAAAGLVGQAFVYALVATDTPGDTLTYSLDLFPAGMTISAAGSISFTSAVAGTFPVTARVTDQGGLFATQSFSLVVRSTNTAPAFTSIPPGTALINRDYRFQLTAVDAPGSILTFSLVSGPAGMTVSAGGLIAWRPATATLVNVSVRVRDQGGLFSTLTFTIQATQAEVLKITRASYSVARAIWAITGTDNLPGSLITLHAGDATGPVIAAVPVLADNTWSFSGAGLVSRGTATKVTAISSTGVGSTASLGVR